MLGKEIYLDNAATTKPLDSLHTLMSVFVDCMWHNPSAQYYPSIKLNRKINETRGLLASAFGSTNHKCVFTSGGTEAANLAVLQSVNLVQGPGKHNAVCGVSEHPCVTESIKQWERLYEIRWVVPDEHGRLTAENVLSHVDENTMFVSIAHVNNVTGAKNDIERIAAGVKKANPRSLFHSDGVQAFLKYPLKNTDNVDLYSVSAHKAHGLPGIGALLYKPGLRLTTMIRGGGQEQGLRSGTENTLGILAFGCVVKYFEDMKQRNDKVARSLRAVLLDYLQRFKDIKIVSPENPDEGSSYILTVAFPGVSGMLLVKTLERQGVYLANGAACSSRKTNVIPYLDTSIAQSLIRISVSAETDEVDALDAMKLLVTEAEKIKGTARKESV